MSYVYDVPLAGKALISVLLYSYDKMCCPSCSHGHDRAEKTPSVSTLCIATLYTTLLQLLDALQYTPGGIHDVVVASSSEMM